jgi:hypothetical protein
MKWSQKADRQVVEAVVTAFRKPDDGMHALLLPLSVHQWERSYYWLDASGMALYLLRQLEDLDLLDTLPREVRTRLKQNYADNQLRSASMLEEFLELNTAFLAAGIDYCNLKGFTLAPISCPDPALRTQLDFDFLVDGRSLDACREVLARRGYVLRAVTDTAWEFKTESNQLADISNLYKVRDQRCIELHFRCDDSSPNRAARDERLDRLSWIDIEGSNIPALSQVDQFIGQATHIFGHLCGPATRLAWLLELKNHVDFHSGDVSFWKRVIDGVKDNGDSAMRVGVACLAMEDILSCPLPDSLEAGLVAPLPQAARLWVENYAQRAVLANFPGTKLHLLLREQIQEGPQEWKTAKRRALMPSRRPPRIIHVDPGGSLRERLAGALCQLRYEAFRARFHIVQGLAYLMEVPRWRHALNQHKATPQSEAKLRSHAVQPQ